MGARRSRTPTSIPVLPPTPGVSQRLSRCGRLRRGLVVDRLCVLTFFTGLADIDSALEVRAVFDADALRDDIAGQRTFVADVHAVRSRHVAANLALHNDLAGGHVSSDNAVTSDSNAVARQIDGAFDTAIDVKRFR